MDQQAILSHLRTLANKEIAAHSRQYFQAYAGGYGDGDQFLGIRVPVIRKAVSQFQDTTLPVIAKLLKSPWHEVRLFALLLLVKQFSKGDAAQQEKIYKLYLRHTKYINNWDLVDSSAPYLVGPWLFDKDRSVLYTLARSRSLWQRRIAIMSTAWFIRNGQYTDTLKLSGMLINDPHDLIHKAVGWMLREIGKRELSVEERYLEKHYQKMPRTMLRYAIEKFPPKRRQAYLAGDI